MTSNDSKEKDKIISETMQEFRRSLKNIEKDSKDAFALVIFINSCFDKKGYADGKFSALVHFPNARKSAWILEQRLLRANTEWFNEAILCARMMLIDSDVVHPDLILS
ncbi:hypothetical protein [Agarivorans litoreus]|uniref:hypothetical protein n=1 Tax=Agarivorans litoreus TaxID=1510455 RepID=UPI001C7D4629|nr:hypothetical protein [Agarivorans litoreus]